MDKKKYKVSYDDVIGPYINVGKLLFSIGILALFCVTTFLVVKYIVNIDVGEKPVDTSHKI